MPTFPRCAGLYAILSEPLIGYARMTRILVEEGVGVVQLRMKNTPASRIVATARRLREITAKSDTLLILNDDPRCAAEADADGVHLGQHDTSVDEAREILGNDKFVGVSTHNKKEVRSACAAQADYIGVGPVFDTSTKKVGHPPLGPDGLRELAALSSLPVVAIGGIGRENIAFLRDTGLAAAAVISAINNTRRPRAHIRFLHSQV